MIGEVLNWHGTQGRGKTGNEYQNRKFGLEVEDTDRWFDGGGNIGTFALLALSVGGYVISVEPERDNAQLLRVNLNANFPNGDWVVEEVGVAVDAGEAKLNVCDDVNKNYRHSMFLTANRHPVRVPVKAFVEFLTKYNILTAFAAVKVGKLVKTIRRRRKNNRGIRDGAAKLTAD